MPYANPEIYGAPETWKGNYLFGGLTGDKSREFRCTKPLVPYWEYEAGTTNKASSQLWKGIDVNKITQNEPIDKSVCPVRQGAASPFRSIGVYRKAIIDDVARDVIKVDSASIEDEYVSGFFYEMSNSSVYNLRCMKGNVYDDKLRMYTIWAPGSYNDDSKSSKHNGNYYIAPFVYYQIKSIVLAIMVGVSNTKIEDLPEIQTEPPQYTYRTIDDWKNNYSDYPIVAARIIGLRANSYEHNDTEISYVRPRSNNYCTTLGYGILDEIKWTDELPMDMYHYGIFTDADNFYSSYISLFRPQTDVTWNNSIHRYVFMPLDNAFSANAKMAFNSVWYQIPYSDDVYERLMEATATFGLPFITDYDNSNYFHIDVDFLSDNLCLPIIDSNRVAQGNYTRGAENFQNPYYYLKSVFDYEPIIPDYEKRREQISVYDINEPQNGFEHNGLAILMPMECISDKEEQGRWDLTLVHPIDDYGKWTYIIIQNVLKVNGQLFRIDETEIYQDAEQAYVTAHAKHITYDLYDRFVDELTGEAATANEYIYQVIQRSQEMLPTHQPEPNEYLFTVSSNIAGPIIKNVRDQTVIGALFGDDNSLASRYGGHLYRDNFRISINTTQEGAPTASAFKLRFGTDLTKISYKIDCSEWITELICKDNFGDVWAISYTGSTWIIHHQKTRIIHFTYDPNTPDPYDCLTKDGFAYWQTVSTPTVSIEVSVANLKNDPKYKDFVDLQNLDVGYEGNVYIEQYGIDINLKIVSIRRDELTGEALQVVLGTSRGSFIRSPVMSQTVVANGTVLGKQEAEMQAMKEKVDDISLNQMRYWRGMKIFKWEDAQNYTWEEIINGRTNDTL